MPQTSTVRTALELVDLGLGRREALLDAVDRSAPLTQADETVPLGGKELVAAFRDLAGSIAWDPVDELRQRIVAAQDPLSLASALIGAKYTALGSSTGLLGSTTSAVTACPDGVGFYRHFAGGSIYWHPLTGAHEVHGLIRERWASLGWEASFLGYPANDELAGRDAASTGRVSHFQRGSLYWSPPAIDPGTVTAPASAVLHLASAEAVVDVSRVLTAGGRTGVLRDVLADDALRTVVLSPLAPHAEQVHEVHGAIRARYLALGGEAGLLGYPMTDETVAPDGTGRYNHFQAGSIYWTPATGAHEVHGLIRSLWASSGWERDPSLGYPVSDELVPDRRTGHRRPEVFRKPVRDLPLDVVKLPSTALGGGFSSSIVNTAPLTERWASGTGLSDRVAESVDADLGGLHLLGDGPGAPRTDPAAERSPHRFADFESGVVFWRRGAAAATRLAPWRADGRAGHTLDAATVLAAVSGRVHAALDGGVATVTGTASAGTTGYWQDGVATHPRQHRVLVTLTEQIAFLHLPVTLEVRAEVGFEPVARTITLALTSWSLLSGGSISVRDLHGRLDPVLWRTVPLLDLTQVHGPDPVAVLSVKTQPDGSVDAYLEPSRFLDLTDVVTHVLTDATLARLQDEPLGHDLSTHLFHQPGFATPVGPRPHP